MLRDVEQLGLAEFVKVDPARSGNMTGASYVDGHAAIRDDLASDGVIGELGMLSTILLIILILLLIGALPSWPYSRGWGYYPSGALTIIVIIIIILLLTGRI
jgi:hypothetical protein